MLMRRAVAAVASAVGRFGESERGNVAMMFAAAAIPLIVAAGGVVDFSRIYFAHTDLQDALDATALTLSKTAPQTATDALNQAAETIFAANFRDADLNELSLTPTYDPSGPRLTVAGTLNVPMFFMGLIGMNNVPVEASSTVVWGETRLRVALVLDNTGSMAQAGKITALKAAAHALLNQLQTNAQKPGDIYVSIVPFSKDVTVDTTSPAFTKAVDMSQFGSCSISADKDKDACGNGGGKWTLYATAWNGCITDRIQNYDTLNTAANTAVPDTLFPPDNYPSCPTLMMGLSDDWNTLNARVDQMQPNGNTNQAIGLAWGWQSLTAAPFSVPPMDPGVTYKQVVILLSDGLNTQDRWYTTANVPAIDARQSTLCGNVKSSAIDIYTVQVDTGGDPTSQLLQDCASDSSQFFLLTNADQIVSTFQQIGTQLTELRVSS